VSPLDPEVPPAGEEIHIPGSSIQPFLLAVGLTITLVGTTTTFILSIFGGILSIAVIVRWIADTRRDVAELPVDHE
jgi:tetrahydromethanopterin S-methyltransferase subunit C